MHPSFLLHLHIFYAYNRDNFFQQVLPITYNFALLEALY